MQLSAIIVAAGSGKRMGFDKLLAPLAGRPVLEHTINQFLKTTSVQDIIVVCPAERLAQLSFPESNKKITRVDGGVDRHDSVFAGIQAISEGADYIAVHDGARPLITSEQIEQVLASAMEHGAATSARRVTETIKRANEKGKITESVSRDNLWLMETPQIFKSTYLKKAYELVFQTGQRVTDEVSALQLIDIATDLVENDLPNLKITYPEDIILAEKLISHQPR